MVVLTHADPKVKAPDGQRGAYESMFQALRTETMSFFGQVLLVHGNGHQLISDRPMRSPSGSPVTNFQRVEVPGGPGAVRWLRLVVDPPGARALHHHPRPARPDLRALGDGVIHTWPSE